MEARRSSTCLVNVTVSPNNLTVPFKEQRPPWFLYIDMIGNAEAIPFLH